MRCDTCSLGPGSNTKAYFSYRNPVTDKAEGFSLYVSIFFRLP